MEEVQVRVEGRRIVEDINGCDKVCESTLKVGRHSN